MQIFKDKASDFLKFRLGEEADHIIQKSKNKELLTDVEAEILAKSVRQGLRNRIASFSVIGLVSLIGLVSVVVFYIFSCGIIPGFLGATAVAIVVGALAYRAIDYWVQRHSTSSVSVIV